MSTNQEIAHKEKCTYSPHHKGIFVRKMQNNDTDYEAVYFKACVVCKRMSGIDRKFCTEKEYKDQPIQAFPY